MKKLTLLFLALNFSFVLTPQFVFSQKINPSHESLSVQMEKINGDMFKTPFRNLTSKEIEITNQLTTLKENAGNGNIEKITELQNRLDGRINSAGNASDIKLISPDANNFKQVPANSDQLTLNEIYASNSAYIKAVATQVEQRDPGAGTVWVVIATGGGDVGVGASPDTLQYYNSTNNGVSFSLVKMFNLNTGMKINYDDMDLEIVEPFTNEKYLHLVLSIITDGFTGIHTAGIISMKKSDLSIGGGPSFAFPGADYSVSKYSKPRITSDNARYPVEAYLTVSVIQDSTDGVNNFIMTKVCKIFNPYALINGTSQITFLPQSIHAPAIGYSDDAMTDVAYYNNDGIPGRDSIIFVQSGFPGSGQFISIYKNYGNTLTYPNYSGSLSGNAYEKSSARVASNGGSDQKSICIVYREKETYLQNHYYSVDIFTTGNGYSWSKSQLAGGGDDNSLIRSPDIIGRRGTYGKFYITLKWVYPGRDMISSFVIENLTLKTFTLDHNNLITGSFASPKPSFRFANGDSCMTVWPTYSNVYSSCGCKAINLNLGFLIQGLYNSVNDSAGTDICEIRLRSVLPPYNILKSVSTYSGSFITFPDANPGIYYISVSHRNSIETWYYQPVNLSDVDYNYFEFYSAQNKAYGSNTKQVDTSPVLYAMYSGDVNQDGIINLTDVISIYNDANIFLSGYVVTDLNGDSIVNLSDLLIANNNSTSFVSVIRP